MKTIPSKEELIPKLEELQEEEARRQIEISAMCYSPEPPPMILPKCDLCGKEIQVENYVWELDWDREGDLIRDWELCRDNKAVARMSDLGYDVKLQFCCKDCAEKIVKERNPSGNALSGLRDGNYLFSFRPNSDCEYHRRIVNDLEMYEKLHALLAKEDFHIEDYRNCSYTPSEKIVLKYMTGLDPDE